MALVVTKSTALTNADAIPPVSNASIITRGMLTTGCGSIAKGASDSNGSIYPFVRVPSNARIVSIGLLNGAITGATSYSCGLYNKALNGTVPTAVSAALFASAVDLTSARTAPVNLRYQVADIANIDKMLWQLLGLSSDPVLDYDICLTATTAGGGAGTISLDVHWTVN